MLKVFCVCVFPRCVPDPAQSSRAGEEPADGLGPRGVHGLWLPPQGRHPRATQRAGCGAGHLQVSLECEGSSTTHTNLDAPRVIVATG